MHILITGASGLVGQHLTRVLLTSYPEHTITLADIITPPIPPSPTPYPKPQNAQCVKSDLLTDDLSPLFSPVPDVVFVFHGIMSGQSETNHALGLAVNIDSSRRFLDALVKVRTGVRVIYASTTAVYGSTPTHPLPSLVSEGIIPRPVSSYGTGKMVMEYILNDYTRRGFVDAITLRFPTVVVRPGKPSPAASAFLSGIIREPFNGVEAILPVGRDLKTWICAPSTLVNNLLVAMTVDGKKLPPHVRQVNMPGTTVNVQEILNAIEKVGGKKLLGYIKEERNEEVERIVGSWPQGFDTKLAKSLGMSGDKEGVVGCVKEYKEWLEEQRSMANGTNGTNGTH